MQNRHVGLHCFKCDVLGGNIRRIQCAVDLETLESFRRDVVAHKVITTFDVSCAAGVSEITAHYKGTF